MIPRPGERRFGTLSTPGIGLGLVLLLASSLAPPSVSGQTQVPGDRIHLSVTFGGYFLVGVGYTRWIERHHAIEATVFPFATPREGFPFAVRLGYAWVPSDEVWRAKLGANLTVLVNPSYPDRDRFTPLIAFTPGLQYDSETHRSFRADVWMSYYLKEKVFAPTAVEFLYAWEK